MLVVSRKDGETIKISDDITIHIIAVPKNDNQVKIGIDVPREVRILREEMPDARKLLPET